jgi:hypothetical protein
LEAKSQMTAYPTLPLFSNPNNYGQSAHHMQQQLNALGLLADTCTASCTNGIPDGYQWVGQRRECCVSALAYPGNLLSTPVTTPVDNLSGYYAGYARNARFVGRIGGDPIV